MDSLHTEVPTSVSTNLTGKDRRCQVRHPLRLSLSCKSVDLAAGNDWFGWCHDLSTNGIQVATGRRFEPKTVLLLALRVSADLVVSSLVARVIWADKNAGGEWLLGCGLVHHLTEDEVNALVDKYGKDGLSSLPPQVLPADGKAGTTDDTVSDIDNDKGDFSVRLRNLSDAPKNRLPTSETVEHLLGPIGDKKIEIRLRSRRADRDPRLPQKQEENPARPIPDEPSRSSPPLEPMLPGPEAHASKNEPAQPVPESVDHERVEVARACEELRQSLACQLKDRDLSGARDTLLDLLELEPGNAKSIATLARVQDLLDCPDKVGELRCFPGHRCTVNTVAFSVDGRHGFSGAGGEYLDGVYTEGKDQTLRMWDLADCRELARFSENSSPVHALACAPCGQRVLAGTRSGSMYSIEVRDFAVFQPVGRHRHMVFSAVFSPDGNRVLTGCDDGIVRLWDLSGNRLHRFEGHGRAVTSVAFSPDGRSAVSGSLDRTIRLWDIESGTMELCLAGHAKAVLSVAIAPDGQHVLSGGADATLRLWEIEGGTEIGSFSGHGDGITCAAFTPQGDRVLSGSLDKTVRLWEVASRTEVYRFEGHTAGVKCLAVSPGGRRALSGSSDKTVRMWALPACALSHESSS